MVKESIRFDSTEDEKTTVYNIHLYPNMVFKNLLPLPVSYMLQGSEETVQLEEGARKEVFDAHLGHSVIEVRVSIKYR